MLTSSGRTPHIFDTIIVRKLHSDAFLDPVFCRFQRFTSPSNTIYHGGLQNARFGILPGYKMSQFGTLPEVVKMRQFGGSNPTYGGVVVVQQHHEHRLCTGCTLSVYRLHTIGIQAAHYRYTGGIPSIPAVDRLHAGCVQSVD